MRRTKAGISSGEEATFQMCSEVGTYTAMRADGERDALHTRNDLCYASFQRFWPQIYGSWICPEEIVEDCGG